MPINVYKVIFAKGEAISCEVTTNHIVFSGDYVYEQHRSGDIIYAFVRAESEEAALQMSSIIIAEAEKRTIPAN